MAKLHVGAVYLNRSVPVSGVGGHELHPAGHLRCRDHRGPETSIFFHPNRSHFPKWASGQRPPPAIVGEVWLTNVEIDKAEDPLPILQLQGTADKDGDSRPFRAAITIGSNRTIANTDATQAGAYPICKERIVFADSRARRHARDRRIAVSAHRSSQIFS